MLSLRLIIYRNFFYNLIKILVKIAPIGQYKIVLKITVFIDRSEVQISVMGAGRNSTDPII